MMPIVSAKSTGFALARMAATAAFLCLAVTAGPAGAAPEIGTAAPELVVTQLDGQTFDLAKLKGKVVLVNYWATWCAPCRKDMPKLDAFYRRYHDRNLAMIGISVDRPSDLQKVRKVMASCLSGCRAEGNHRQRLWRAGRGADHLDHRYRR